uniref:Uncharacterized protein n=1 Tax=Gadus morhua TaxID=8049 RepID=A0A8C5AHZ9_GADMO
MVVNAGRRGTKRKADAVQEEEKVAVELKESKEEVKDNDSGGRRVIIEHCKKRGKESILWTGIKKGPPARLKFPEPAVVVAALEEALEEAPEEAPVEAVKTE